MVTQPRQGPSSLSQEALVLQNEASCHSLQNSPTPAREGAPGRWVATQCCLPPWSKASLLALSHAPRPHLTDEELGSEKGGHPRAAPSPAQLGMSQALSVLLPLGQEALMLAYIPTGRLVGEGPPRGPHCCPPLSRAER